MYIWHQHNGMDPESFNIQLTEFCLADLVCNTRLPYCGAIGHHWSDHNGVSILILFQHKFNIFGIASQLQSCSPCCKLVPVTTAWHVLRLRMEERPPIWRVAANILNMQSQIADKGWSSSLGVGRGANNSSLWKPISVMKHLQTKPGPGLILWCDQSNKRGTWNLVPGMLGACTGQVHLWKQPGN
jgi:hypothetical protein